LIYLCSDVCLTQKIVLTSATGPTIDPCFSQKLEIHLNSKLQRKVTDKSNKKARTFSTSLTRF